MISSHQVSGIIGGQQAMFSNQAHYAQQISGMYGMAAPVPPMQAPQMPSYGHAEYAPGAFPIIGAPDSPGGMGPLAVGTMGRALPAMAAGASLFGGFAGGAAGIMDPYTTAMGAFAKGAGVGGQGFFGGASALGNVFAKQGVGAGLGALGKGAMLGGAVALPYMAAGAAISHVGQNIYQGAQNLSQAGELMAGQGPAYGQSGSRIGGAISRSQIGDVVQIMHDLTSDPDLKATVSQLNELATMAQRGGMLTGVTNASDFKQKFSSIVSQVKEVAQIMGSSLDEAMPLLGQMRQMGMWKTSDVMGTAHALQQVGGAAAPHLMGAMQAGSNMSWQQGGSLGAGAAIGRQSFMQVQAAARTGILPDEAIMELTGGVGGLQGQEMISGMLSRGVSTFAQTSAGRALMAGFGEMDGQTFTGNIDRDRLQQFMSGGTDIGQVLSQGRGRTGSQQAATSFTVRQDHLGQELMAHGGLEAIGATIESVMERAGHADGSDEIRNMFIQRMMGLSGREAEMFRTMLDDLPRIQEDANRRARAAIDDQFRRLDERQNRSWQGLKESMGYAMDQTFSRPIQEAAARAGTRIGRGFDNLSDAVMGRSRQYQVSQKDQERMLRQHGLSGLSAMGEGLDGSLSMDMQTTIAERLRRDPSGTLGRMSGAAGALFAGGMAAPFTAGASLAAGAVGAYQIMSGGYSREAVFQASGASSPEEMQDVAQRSAMRAMDPTMRGLGVSSAQRGKVDAVKSRISKMMQDPNIARELKKVRGSNPEAYLQHFMSVVNRDPSVAAELSGLSSEEQKDLIAVAQNEGGITSDLAAPFAEIGAAMGVATMGTREGLDRHMEKTIGDMAKLASEQGEVGIREVASTWLGGLAGLVTEGGRRIGSAIGGETGRTIGGIAGAVIGHTMTLGTGLLGHGISELIKEHAVDETDIREAIENEEWGNDFVEWLGGTTSPDNAFVKALEKGDASAERLRDSIGRASPEAKAGVAKHIRSNRAARVSQKRLEEIKTSAGREASLLGRVKEMGGISEGAVEQYEKILESFKSGSSGGFREGRDTAMELARTISGKDAAMLAQQGEVGKHIQSLRAIHQMGGRDVDVSEKQFRREFRRKLGRHGLDIEQLISEGGELGEGLKEVLSDGTVTAEERSKVMQQVKQAMAGAGPQRGPVDREQNLYKLLTSYTDAHSKFVLSVGAAVTGMDSKDAKKMQEAIGELGSGVGNEGRVS